MNLLHLRFCAPMMSFGGPMVDNFGVIQTFPGLAMLTGLLANALGYDHRDDKKTQALQSRIRYGARIEKSGEKMQDFQSVALGADYMLGGWTTRGYTEGRGDSAASKGTHLRYRDYWVDAICSVILTLKDGEGPSLDEIQNALIRPARPLFIGRKPCVPAEPIFVQQIEFDNIEQALSNVKLHPRAEKRARYLCFLNSKPEDDYAKVVVDGRNWKNQIIVGERWVVEKLVPFTGGDR